MRTLGMLTKIILFDSLNGGKGLMKTGNTKSSNNTK